MARTRKKSPFDRAGTRLRWLTGLWRRRRVRVALAIAVVLLALFVALRYGIGLGVKIWLRTHKAADIKVRAIDIDPFTGRAGVRDLSIAIAGGKPLLVPEARVRLAIVPLLLGRREVDVEYVTLSGVRASFERTGDGTIKVAGLPVPQARDDVAETPTTWVISFDRLGLADSVLEFRGYNLAVHLPIDNARLSGRLALGAGKSDATLRADVALGAFSVQAIQPDAVTVAAATRATFKGIRVEGVSSIGIREAELRDLHLVQPLHADKTAVTPAAVARIPRLTLRQVDYDGTRSIAGIATVLLETPTLYLARDARRRWYGIDPLRDAWKEAQRSLRRAGVKAPAGARPFGLRINLAESRGSAHLTFVDRSVQPAYRETLTLRRLEVAHLDSRSPARWLQVELGGTVGRHAPLTASVRARPFAPKLSLIGEATLKEFDLPTLSGYTAGLMGYHIKSGRLEAAFELSVRDDEIGGEHSVTLHNIDVVEADPEKMAALHAQLNMPLGSALSMLRDKQNNIHLELPMSGNIRDPKFHVGDTINRALGKAMRSAALSYAAYSLQPFGTLLAVIQLAGGATALALDPVLFAPAKVAIEPEPALYLERVAAMLAERPKLRLRLCAVAVPADAAAATQDLHELGRARAQAVEDALVDRHGVDRKRLFICHPEVTDDPKAKPRVDLVI